MQDNNTTVLREPQPRYEGTGKGFERIGAILPRTMDALLHRWERARDGRASCESVMAQGFDASLSFRIDQQIACEEATATDIELALAQQEGQQ